MRVTVSECNIQSVSESVRESDSQAGSVTVSQCVGQSEFQPVTATVVMYKVYLHYLNNGTIYLLRTAPTCPVP